MDRFVHGSARRRGNGSVGRGRSQRAPGEKKEAPARVAEASKVIGGAWDLGSFGSRGTLGPPRPTPGALRHDASKLPRAVEAARGRARKAGGTRGPSTG